MSEKNDGGPAFPVPNDANVNGQEGMTLRDYFAAKAMQACVADPDWRREYAASTSEAAYYVADAMIAAREAKS